MRKQKRNGIWACLNHSKDDKLEVGASYSPVSEQWILLIFLQGSGSGFSKAGKNDQQLLGKKTDWKLESHEQGLQKGGLPADSNRYGWGDAGVDKWARLEYLNG